jgi:hypothetical protein
VAKQLVSASAAQVKAKAVDLVDSQPSCSFRVLKGGNTPEIIFAYGIEEYMEAIVIDAKIKLSRMCLEVC